MHFFYSWPDSLTVHVQNRVTFAHQKWPRGHFWPEKWPRPWPWGIFFTSQMHWFHTEWLSKSDRGRVTSRKHYKSRVTFNYQKWPSQPGGRGKSDPGVTMLGRSKSKSQVSNPSQGISVQSMFFDQGVWLLRVPIQVNGNENLTHAPNTKRLEIYMDFIIFFVIYLKWINIQHRKVWSIL